MEGSVRPNGFVELLKLQTSGHWFGSSILTDGHGLDAIMERSPSGGKGQAEALLQPLLQQRLQLLWADAVQAQAAAAQPKHRAPAFGPEPGQLQQALAHQQQGLAPVGLLRAVGGGGNGGVKRRAREGRDSRRWAAAAGAAACGVQGRAGHGLHRLPGGCPACMYTALKKASRAWYPLPSTHSTCRASRRRVSAQRPRAAAAAAAPPEAAAAGDSAMPRRPPVRAAEAGKRGQGDGAPTVGAKEVDWARSSHLLRLPAAQQLAKAAPEKTLCTRSLKALAGRGRLKLM